MNENSLQTFNSETFGNVRAYETDGEIWFVGADVAKALEYTNTTKALKDHIDNEDKLIERIVTSGQKRAVTLINESGLYSLIFSSKLPKAKKFKRWVTSEVLPALRSNGRYIIESEYDDENGEPCCDRLAISVVSVSQRLSVAKLLMSAKPDRLPVIKKVLQPIVPEADLDSLLPTDIPPLKIGTKEFTTDVVNEVVRRAYALARNAGEYDEDKNEYYIPSKVFASAFADVGNLPAKKILLREGCLIPSTQVACSRYMYWRYIDGVRTMCVILRGNADKQETEVEDGK